MNILSTTDLNSVFIHNMFQTDLWLKIISVHLICIPKVVQKFIWLCKSIKLVKMMRLFSNLQSQSKGFNKKHFPVCSQVYSKKKNTHTHNDTTELSENKHV